jgi:uncharacterized MAPEG superfamily protein
MTPELQFLSYSIVLGIIHIAASAHATQWVYGYWWGAGPRDTQPAVEGVLAGRLRRALSNFGETFPLFAAAVVAVHIVGRSDWLTELGAQMYLWGRVAYLPLYASGIPLVRSFAWNIATLGIVLITLRLLV